MKDYFEPPVSSGRRAASYWYVDGLPHAVFGLALLMSGALALLWRVYLPNPRLGHYFAIGMMFVLYSLMGRHFVDILKSRVTYPRTGYVQPPEEAERISLTTLSLQPGPQPKENATSFDRRIAIVIFFFVLTPFSAAPRWFVPVLMAALAATLYVLNRNSEPPFRWWSVLVLGLMGLVFLWVDVPLLVQPSLPLLLVGLWLVAQGGETLIKYLRGNRGPQIPEGNRT
ncbi:MAG TPA: hypothetical protein VN442_05375 [Bryobacteraceae bacterium]|nr:hypothetical protein [Bryobacteraceae bacterium]